MIRTFWYYILCTVEPAMSSHPCDTGRLALKCRWLLRGGTFVYKMEFWGIAKWPPIGGWLLIAGFTVLTIILLRKFYFLKITHIFLFEHKYLQIFKITMIFHKIKTHFPYNLFPILDILIYISNSFCIF